VLAVPGFSTITTSGAASGHGVKSATQRRPSAPRFTIS
jgi:hypothetical protein